MARASASQRAFRPPTSLSARCLTASRKMDSGFSSPMGTPGFREQYSVNFVPAAGGFASLVWSICSTTGTCDSLSVKRRRVLFRQVDLAALLVGLAHSLEEPCFTMSANKEPPLRCKRRQPGHPLKLAQNVVDSLRMAQLEA